MEESPKLVEQTRAYRPLKIQEWCIGEVLPEL